MIIAKTQSVCPVCLRVIDANRVEGEDGNIYLTKECPEHGAFSALIWEGSLESYLAWGDGGATSKRRGDCPRGCGLCGSHESEGCCVLLELTSRCNLNCPVCFASAGDAKSVDPSLDEIALIYDMMLERGGPFNVQLSGGEPTLRDDLPEIVALGQKKGFTFFQLNTNGLRLAQEEGYAKSLSDCGVSCAFLQFDGMSEYPYRVLRGRDLAKVKHRAIENCAAAGLPVVLVPTLARGVNDEVALGDIILFALENAPAIRGVHIQPISYFGRCEIPPAERLTIPRILREIEEQTGGLMKASDFSGSGAQSPYCSFHAGYIRGKDGLRALKQQKGECCPKSAQAKEFVARQWGHKKRIAQSDAPMTNASSLDAFLEQAEQNTFTLSGMVFQDGWTLDLQRLRRCYVCEADGKRGLVPFCAYNLTNDKGKGLYRK